MQILFQIAEKDELVSDMHHHIAQLTEELQNKADEVDSSHDH